MGAELRQLRSRVRSVRSIAKVTRAYELIAASKIIKAQQRVTASVPYEREIIRTASAVVSGASSTVKHPLTTENPDARRAAVLLVTSDRGFCGGYNANVLREGESLVGLLRDEGKEVVPYISGTKGIHYYTFRQREFAGSWSGFSDRPAYANAKEIADTLIQAFNTPVEDGGVDEIHVVRTEFVSMLKQEPVARRILPLEVKETTEEPPGGPLPLYDFEPSMEGVLDELLPRYVESRLFHGFLQAAASELAARQRAMKSATDNAGDLIEDLTRRANQARQAEITQEISEIVGGANALADATAGE